MPLYTLPEAGHPLVKSRSEPTLLIRTSKSAQLSMGLKPPAQARLIIIHCLVAIELNALRP